MNKWIKYFIGIIILLFLGYNSIFFEKLSKRVSHKGVGMDVVSLAKKVWLEKLPSKVTAAIDIDSLEYMIASSPAQTFTNYTHSLALGNYKYVIVKGHAQVIKVGTDDISIQVQSRKPFNAFIEMEFIYGNTLRDALGIFKLNDFPNTDDLNNLSEELNKIVKREVVPSLKSSLKTGDNIDFVGAIQLNEAHIHFDGLEIVPLTVKVVE